MKTKLLVCVPFTGLGLYAGFRGNRWLRNRIKIFKQFVIPSLQAQTDRDFVLWIAWREEEKTNPHVQALEGWLRYFTDLKFVFTYTGCPMWDDKYPDEVARERLFRTLKDGLPQLFDVVEGAEEIHWLLQPSDDCYHRETVASVKKVFEDPKVQAVTYKQGYLCNYHTLDVLEYNPKTNPPFFAIKYPRQVFFDPGKHLSYTGPFKSHEYIGDKLNLAYFEGRGFLVGTHGENISTHFNHPYGGRRFEGPEREQILWELGIHESPQLQLPKSFRKWLLRKLPHRVRRKLRYWGGEIIGNRIYHWIRN